MKHWMTMLAGACALVLSAVAAEAADLNVSAAASLSEAFREIGPAFETARPGVKLNFRFGPSGQLLEDIDVDGATDVFAASDLQTMARAMKDGVVGEASRTLFATNALVVAVPADAVRIPEHPTDLVRVDIRRIAIANPDTDPAGKYAHDLLRTARVWPDVRGRIVLTEDVRQAVDRLAAGEVDAAIVFRTDALTATNRVRIAFTVATEDPIVYSAAVLRRSANAADAVAFVQFLRTAAAQRILERFGFSRP